MGRSRKPDPARPRFGRVSEVIDDPSRPILDLMHETNEQTAATLAAAQTMPAPVETPIKETPMTTHALALTTAKKVETLATSDVLPGELAAYFNQEEWAALPTADRVSAIEFLLDEMKTTTEGLEINFPRVKYPTAGASFWEVPTATGDDEAIKELEGCVVFKQPVRAYWPLTQEPGKNPPTCSSLDAITPVDGEGRQAKICAACPHAQWGSGKDGRGQACKKRLNTFLLRDGQDVPTLLSLPPSALRTFGDYAIQLRQSRSALVAVTTVFGLTKATSGGGVEYKALTLKIGRKLRFAEMQQAASIRAMFENQMAKRGIKVDEAEEDPAPGSDPQVLDQNGKVVA